MRQYRDAPRDVSRRRPCARRRLPPVGGNAAGAIVLLGAAGRVVRGRRTAKSSASSARNGAGKSTLLKILSRDHRADRRRAVQSRGRVGSLLEVGTGFHPELTGPREHVPERRDPRHEARRDRCAKFDEIVAFAEVEPFIDTPVKHYSSGMYLRLAFAVAAHLEPEILLVDEVLAVGDAAFQKKCLGKMDDVAQRGPHGLFVSHNMEAIQRLCSHAVMLEAGQVAAFGDTSTVVGQYLSRDYLRPAPGARIDVSSSREQGRAMPGSSRSPTRPAAGSTVVLPYPDGPLEFVLEIESDAPATCAACRCSCSSSTAQKFSMPTRCTSSRTVSLRQGRNTVRLRIASIHLLPGTYRVGLWLADPVQAQSVTGAYDYVESAFEIEVVTRGVTAPAGTGGIVTCDFDR